jgi:hypothetical protein
MMPDFDPQVGDPVFYRPDEKTSHPAVIMAVLGRTGT